VDRACGLSFDAVTTPERLAFLERLETVARRLPVPGHELINGLVQTATPAEIGGKLPHVLGCTSAAPRPTGVSAKPPTWALGRR